MSLRMVSVSKLERASQHADRVVVGLLTPRCFVRDFDECRVAHREKRGVPDLGPPEPVENPSVRCDGARRHVVLGHARFAVRQKGVEHLTAGSRQASARHRVEIAKIRELVSERERASGYPLLDDGELPASAPEVCLRGSPQHGWAEPATLEAEVKPNSVSASGDHTASCRFLAH